MACTAVARLGSICATVKLAQSRAAAVAWKIDSRVLCCAVQAKQLKKDKWTGEQWTFT